MKKVLALGFFDCLHKGHRSVFEAARRLAASDEGRVCVCTFDDGFFAATGRDAKEIYLLEERRDLFRKLGIDDVCVFPTDEAFMNLSKKEFVTYLKTLSPDCIVVGEDYRFGKNACGTVTDLTKAFDFVCICSTVTDNGVKISSEMIRSLLSSGAIESANRLLCDPFFYSGTVRNGRKEGRKMGFPTINLDVPKEKIRIKCGVYVTKTEIDGVCYSSVTNVGAHPTFCDRTFNVETFLIDRDVQAYGKKATVYFYRYIRDVVKFEDAQALQKQIRKDVEYARGICL